LKKDILLRLPLVRHLNALSLAFGAACIGIFLIVASLAELPNERRFIAELTLVLPILLYALASLMKRDR
jgi:hypothetical protein